MGEPGRGAATRVARLLVDRAEGGGVVLELGLTPLVELLRARRAPEEPWHHGGTHCEDEVERGRHAQAVLEADAALGVALAVAAVAVAHDVLELDAVLLEHLRRDTVEPVLRLWHLGLGLRVRVGVRVRVRL